jgi:hypothetical protein
VTDAKDVTLSLFDAEGLRETIDWTIDHVIDQSMESIDYGNSKKLAREMETLHKLRMAQEALEKAVEESAHE